MAQQPHAVINDFAPTVKGVTVGTTHCYFWFHASVQRPYDSEVACYENSVVKVIHVALPDVKSVESFNFDTGSIAWQITPSKTDAAKIDYEISGQAVGESMPVLEIGTL